MENTEADPSVATKPLSAAQVLCGYRDLGEVRAEGAAPALACDPNFNRYTSYWLTGETLDATYAALEGMMLLSEERAAEFLRLNGHVIISSLRSRFNADFGTFRTDHSDRTCGIYACHAAMGVIKSLSSVPCRKPIEALLYRQTIQKFVGSALAQDPVAALLGFLRQTAEASPIEGGMVDRPGNTVPASLTIVFTATSLLWNLFPEDASERFLAIVPENHIRSLLGECLKTYDVGSYTIAGFAIHPDIQELCVNTTWFGLQLLERLKIRQQFLDAAMTERILRFLRLSFREGGFTSTLGEVPSLNATFFGLRCCKMLMSEGRFSQFLLDHGAEIRRFACSCVNPRSGGAAFAPDRDRYVENCLATRYFIQILSDFLGCKGSHAEWKQRAFAYYVAQFDPSSGGFRGYPSDRVECLSRGSDWLERLLAAKDERLQARISPPSPLSVDLEAAYQRLSNLYAEAQRRGADTADLQVQIESAVEHLKMVQHDEAHRLRRSLEARLSMPLNRGRKLMVAVQELRNQYGDPPKPNPAVQSADNTSP